MRKGQKFLVGLASLTLWDIAAASAADLPVKAPAPVATYNWSGFYVGGHAGYRWADPDFSGSAYDFDTGIVGIFTSPARSESYRLHGGIVGVQAGYNFMITPTILAGLEGDWTWGSSSDAKTGSSVDVLGDGFTFRSEVRLTWQATIRGRVGVVNGPWLFYGTGGAAFARARWTDNTSVLIVGTPFSASSWDVSKTMTGWVVGGGVEYMFAKNSNWIARLEYLYENFGDVSVPFGLGPQAGTLDLKDVNKVRIAVSYKFTP